MNDRDVKTETSGVQEGINLLLRWINAGIESQKGHWNSMASAARQCEGSDGTPRNTH